MSPATWRQSAATVAACFVATEVFVSTVRAQGGLGNFRCITGHNYSSNWNKHTDIVRNRDPLWWYYDYKPDESIPLKETSCGPGFDACRTEILVHEMEAFDDGSISYVPFKSAEMIMTCSYMDYCYPEDEVYMYNDPNALVYHNEDPDKYTHQVRRIVECCNSEWSCNIDDSGLYANAYASATAAELSFSVLGAVVAASYILVAR